jgi:glycosyltransferase involved in cell wall biosynthesis
MKPLIHAIILTLNEELHIRRCIESILPVVDTILVVDSGSTDNTCEIARSLGAQVKHNAWTNHATQLNFAIAVLENKGGWILRIDADEVLQADQSLFLQNVSDEVAGITIQRRIYFMGQRMRHGGIEPSYQLRLWRNGLGRCEQRWMDEHVVVQGQVLKSDMVVSDINLNSLHWWTTKHNDYASREAIEVLNRKHCFLDRRDNKQQILSFQAKLRRSLKEHVYLKLPSGLRAIFYFIYRYVLRLGFLDGRAGYYFHLLQGLWYRSLVDAKVIEIESFAHEKSVKIPEAIFVKTGIRV